MLALVCATLFAPATARASVWDVEQPPHQPRTVVVARPVRIYADPTVLPRAPLVRTVAASDVEAALRRVVARDDRLVTLDFTRAALDAGRSDAQVDLAFIAEQSARLGAEYIQTYSLASARSELESSVSTYARTLLPWIRADAVASVYRDLALVHLELAHDDPAAAAAELGRADTSFRAMIRIAPSVALDESRYPSSVVDAYRAAYAGLLAERGRALRMRADELRFVASSLDADLVVYAFLIAHEQGATVVLQVFDARESRFVADEELEVDASLDAVVDALTAALGASLECLEPIAPPAPPRPPEAGHTWLELSFSSGAYTGRPTSAYFYNRGVRLGLSRMLRDTFGLFGSVTQWGSRSDANGELLGSVDSTRVLAGGLAGARFRRARAYAEMGLDVTRIGRVSATDSFWCKVSEGEPFAFDEDRECRASDIVATRPGAQVGLHVGLGGDVQISGPFWLHLLAGATLYVAPFDQERALNGPIWLDVGGQYRF